LPTARVSEARQGFAHTTRLVAVAKCAGPPGSAWPPSNRHLACVTDMNVSCHVNGQARSLRTRPSCCCVATPAAATWACGLLLRSSTTRAPPTATACWSASAWWVVKGRPAVLWLQADGVCCARACSCTPFDAQLLPLTAQQVVRAGKDIAAGAELGLSYLGPQLFAPAAERQDELQQQWDFNCGCSRCACAREWQRVVFGVTQPSAVSTPGCEGCVL
jgi:hypothetical protein